MRNEQLVKRVEKYDDIVIFGAGFIGLYLYDLLSKNEGKRVSILDNDRTKRESCGAINVVAIDEINYVQGRTVFCLSSEVHFDVMKCQLLEMEVELTDIFLGVTDEANKAWEVQKRKEKLTPLAKIRFEIDLVAHCNLNCKCCSQFSGIADEEFMSLSVVESDMKRMSELFDGEAERIYLIGGEPLLHPDICECMKIARKYFKKAKVSIFTNGLLINKCSGFFWDICRKYNISIMITKYPIALDYEKLKKKLQDEKVKYEFFGASEDYKYMNNLGLVPEGNKSAYKNFTNCSEANNCIKLREGKLYTCTRPAVIYRFNKYFDTKFEVSENDYLDIYQNYSAQEILERLAKPIPFCRYCDMCGKRKSMEWGRTEKRKEEWL